jgi:SAM-dependent methyltransferase
MPFQQESVWMSSLRRLGLERLAWALRRFHVPVGASDLVLEVGSGGNPYPRANVLLDAYESTRERHWAPLATDRPTVLGFVENLPFKDKSFDFVIAAHVLEHSTDPARFIAELERVAKAGYIEVPDALLERVNPYRDHRLEITCRDQTLVIRKKPGWRADAELVELYEDRVKPVFTKELVPRHPFAFHVRHYWDNKIAYRVLNPDVDAAWVAPAADASASCSRHGGIRDSLRDGFRLALSQRARNAELDPVPCMRCTRCHGVQLSREVAAVMCVSCGERYPVRGRLIAMNEACPSAKA